MMLRTLLPILLVASNADVGAAFRTPPSSSSSSSAVVARRHCYGRSDIIRTEHDVALRASDSDNDGDGGSKKSSASSTKADNKSMAFLRKIGRVGGAANMDFANAMGLDESPSGGSKSSYHEDGTFKNVRKSKAAYIPCTTSGIIDDMSDPFPFTSSGSQWQGITDRVMGGTSNGSLSRETVDDKLANVLRGNVSMENGGGFIQMATDLSLDPSTDPFVDASEYDGVELEVYCDCEGADKECDIEEKFNVHLRTPACERQNSSYRSTLTIQPGRWALVRVPWSEFIGYGPGPDVTPFVPLLRRLGVVSIGEAKNDVVLAVGKIGFYNVI
eukprot:CAMPEP_0181135342 /NCGR_PEP_ID=MMETSP1071-20121207/32569_1 /TAXON_ID=35127 /ORGANISM="Thalassiosira sp., Strain NH16" /LENGTH=328 /DNA_ID=CAMNT_0023221919 /DNA_START=163 /DNA_END=1149 /DNA_ORIENTATION=-